MFYKIFKYDPDKRIYIKIVVSLSRKVVNALGMSDRHPKRF